MMQVQYLWQFEKKKLKWNRTKYLAQNTTVSTTKKNVKH